MTAVLSNSWVLCAWAVLAAVCVMVVIRDLAVRNSHLMSLMKVVWVLTVAYSGPIGLAVYWFSGRKEIATDGLARRGFRSVAHCYSGCGMGEIVGVVLAVGLLSLGAAWSSAITFAFAYTFGIILTVGPLMQGGTAFGGALKDAVIAETPSIAVMEAVAIGVNTWLSGPAGLGHVLFWSALVVSLSCGLFAAWPVNVALIRAGVKQGMMDPRHAQDH